MAGNLVITCPECEKKFKPKADVSGKKIKCPFCTHPFLVPAAKASKSEAVKSGKPKSASTEVKPAPDANGDEVENDNPYGVKTTELVPRCPNCTQEMGPHDIICLACGYNTVLRTWGKTEKTLGVTFGQHFLYLLPALGAAAFVVLSVIFLLIYDVMVPYWVADSWMAFVDHESMRMWTTLIFLGWLWGAGMFCFKKFIEKPKPDEIKVEERAD